MSEPTIEDAVNAVMNYHPEWPNQDENGPFAVEARTWGQAIQVAAAYCHAREEIARLRRRLEIAERALAEYASTGRWYTGSHGTLEVVFDSFDEDQDGWKVAQDALDDIRKVK